MVVQNPAVVDTDYEQNPANTLFDDVDYLDMPLQVRGNK